MRNEKEQELDFKTSPKLTSSRHRWINTFFVENDLLNFMIVLEKIVMTHLEANQKCEPNYCPSNDE